MVVKKQPRDESRGAVCVFSIFSHHRGAYEHVMMLITSERRWDKELIFLIFRFFVWKLYHQ